LPGRSARHPCGAHRGTHRGAPGAATVEFLAVALLTVTCLLGVAQFAVWVWARNVAVHAVHDGARLAAERGRDPAEGALRARVLLRDGLGRAGGAFAVLAAQDGPQVAVAAEGDAPVILPVMPRLRVSVRAEALDEDAVLP